MSQPQWAGCPNHRFNSFFMSFCDSVSNSGLSAAFVIFVNNKAWSIDIQDGQILFSFLQKATVITPTVDRACIATKMVIEATGIDLWGISLMATDGSPSPWLEFMFTPTAATRRDRRVAHRMPAARPTDSKDEITLTAIGTSQICWPLSEDGELAASTTAGWMMATIQVNTSTTTIRLGVRTWSYRSAFTVATYRSPIMAQTFNVDAMLKNASTGTAQWHGPVARPSGTAQWHGPVARPSGTDKVPSGRTNW